MKTCWQILEIESTTQIDIIRQAYLARLPLCHPETDLNRPGNPGD